MNYIMKIKNYVIEILISTLVLILLFYSSDPVFYSDSRRYLIGSLDDRPLYFFIITTIQSIFIILEQGLDLIEIAPNANNSLYHLKMVVILQTCFVGFGTIFITKTITKYFDINIIIKTVIALFLFIPFIEFYNHILTEPFSYGFSLFFVGSVIRLIYNFNILNLVWSSIFIIALILMRNQFIFLYPVILLLYLGILYIYRSKKKLILLTISFLSIILIQNSLMSLNKYIKQDSFKSKTVSNNEGGVFNFIYIDAIYISTIQDIEIFKDNNLKKTITKIFQESDEQKALLKHYNGRGHFGFSFAIIMSQSNLLFKDLAIQNNTTMAKIKKDVSIKLIKKNFKKYIKFLFKKSYDSSWLFIFLPFFMILAAFPIFLKQRSNFSLLIMFLSTFSLANHSIVYLFGRVQPRYFIYTDFILLIFIFVFFNIFLQKK
jgi:hypothetical protein